MRNLFFSLLLAALFNPLQAQLDWRYDRTGIYRNETGLLKSWHENGPEMLWIVEGLGTGWSSPLVLNEKLYVTGMSEDRVGYLFVFDMNGGLLHKKEYGTEWYRSYPGARAMPVASDGKVYVVSGTANIICFDEQTLNIIWKKELPDEFGYRRINWGFNESPVIVGDKLIITPGGTEHNIVALNKNDGSLIWSSRARGEVSAYCSPVYVNAPGIVPQVVTITAAHVVGIDIETGNMMWSFPFRERNSVHPNTPLFFDNKLLCMASEYGALMLRFINGGRDVEQMWFQQKLDPITGHSVIIGDYIYTSKYPRRAGHMWFCANRHTGEILFEDNSLASGAIIYADGMFYIYTERGEMALVKPDTEKLNIVSQFRITRGTGEHWSHPVIYNGIMYVRHGNSMMAYKVK